MIGSKVLAYHPAQGSGWQFEATILDRFDTGYLCEITKLRGCNKYCVGNTEMVAPDTIVKVLEKVEDRGSIGKQVRQSGLRSLKS